MPKLNVIIGEVKLLTTAVPFVQAVGETCEMQYFQALDEILALRKDKRVRRIGFHEHLAIEQIATLVRSFERYC